ncbi:TlpA disulfide reductase family protein [soil metagenome]
MKIRTTVASIVTVAAIGVGAYFALGAKEMAPTVAYTVLDGTKVDTSQLRGKVVLVNFWATSCVTCVQEMPQMIATHNKFAGKGYETMAVAMSYDPPAYVVNFTETRKLPFKVVIDNTGSIARSFGDVQLTPTSVLINKRGEVVKRYVGEPDFAALHTLVEKLLVES